MTAKCFHCDEDIPSGFKVNVDFDGKLEPVCCIGCEAVANQIIDNGLSSYYNFRTDKAIKAGELSEELVQLLTTFDDEELQNDFTENVENTEGNKDKENAAITLSIEGMTCAACAWLIQKRISVVSGVKSIEVNATTMRAHLVWEKQLLPLSSILKEIHNLGYKALPFSIDQSEASQNLKNKQFIVRLGVAGIMTMQVMMLAFALYFGVFGGLEDGHKTFLQWVSLTLSTPVILYSAFPFLVNAINGLKSKTLNMDLPVSIAIYGAYISSVIATIQNTGEVYFESITMFTFLLLLGKYLEFRTRMRATEYSSNLHKFVPYNAIKLVDGKEVPIAAKKLRTEDIVLVKPGQTVPGDGVVIEGTSSIDESMMSGESNPVVKNIETLVFAGTVNIDGYLKVKITKSQDANRINSILTLQNKTLALRPTLSKYTDTVASWFTFSLLLISSGTYLYWYNQGNPDAFWITISVLVATCPCALSLATPTALTCAMAQLNKNGVIIKESHVFETLSKLTHVLFDKTGTLTTGQLVIANYEVLSDRFNEQEILSVISALEAYSEHPIARCFSQYEREKVTNIEIKTGQGISGIFNGYNVYFGKHTLNSQYNSQSVLIINDEAIAHFSFSDAIRTEAEQVVHSLKREHIITIMLSGDPNKNALTVSKTIKLDEAQYDKSPEQKVEVIKGLTQDNKIVAMVGDGINDSPAFSASHLSIAMNSGTDISKSTADVILVSNKLTGISKLINTNKQTSQIIKQNIGWAILYNIIVLPIAISGQLPPWIAVIGMSTSSLIVMFNSLRLLKK